MERTEKNERKLLKKRNNTSRLYECIATKAECLASYWNKF